MLEIFQMFLIFMANSTPGFRNPGIGTDLVLPIPGH
jgi:hypothetical protein